MSFARGMDPEVADRFVGMWVNDMTIEMGERGRLAVQTFLDRGFEAGLIPKRVARRLRRGLSREPAAAALYRALPPPAPSPTSTGGLVHPLEAAWHDAPALVLIGHSDCSTTRQAIPYVDRIHRRKTRGVVVLVLQDDARAARQLTAEESLSLPIRLEPDPYPLARALDLGVVPALVLVDREGRIDRVSVGFRRADLDAFAARLGVAGTLVSLEDASPSFRPG